MQAETLSNFWLDVRISDSDLEGDKKIWLFMEIKRNFLKRIYRYALSNL